MFSPSDSEWHDSEIKPLIFAGLQPLPGPKLWRREYLCSPPGRWSQLAQKPFAKKLCSSKAMPTPWSSCYGIKFENDCKSLCKTFQLQSRTSAVDPGFFVIPCAVLDSAKLVAEGIRQVCHKKRANEGCNGILKCAFHGHHFALRHKLRMLCIIV